MFSWESYQMLTCIGWPDQKSASSKIWRCESEKSGVSYQRPCQPDHKCGAQCERKLTALGSALLGAPPSARWRRSSDGFPVTGVALWLALGGCAHFTPKKRGRKLVCNARRRSRRGMFVFLTVSKNIIPKSKMKYVLMGSIYAINDPGMRPQTIDF